EEPRQGDRGQGDEGAGGRDRQAQAAGPQLLRRGPGCEDHRGYGPLHGHRRRRLRRSGPEAREVARARARDLFLYVGDVSRRRLDHRSEHMARKLGKKRAAAFKRVDRLTRYKVEDALKLVKGCKTSKFDESVDVAVNLGVD